MTSMTQPQVEDWRDTLPESAVALEAKISAERQRLRHRIDVLGTTIREKADPQTYWRENPLVLVGVAAAAGVVLGLVSGGSARRDGDSDEARRERRNRESTDGGSMAQRLMVAALTLVGRRAFSKVIDSAFSASTRGK